MIWIIVALVAIYIAGVVGVAYLSLHPPRIPLFTSPGAFGAPQEEVRIPFDADLLWGKLARIWGIHSLHIQPE